MCLVNELARFNKIQPEYKLLSEQGPAHSKVSVHSRSLLLLLLPLQEWEATCVVLVQDNPEEWGGKGAPIAPVAGKGEAGTWEVKSWVPKMSQQPQGVKGLTFTKSIGITFRTSGQLCFIHLWPCRGFYGTV